MHAPIVPNEPTLHAVSILGLVSPFLHTLPEIASFAGAVLGATYYGLLIWDRRSHKGDTK